MLLVWWGARPGRFTGTGPVVAGTEDLGLDSGCEWQCSDLCSALLDSQGKSGSKVPNEVYI